MASAEIKRDGFSTAYGRFYAGPGRVERVSGSTLRASFLPKLTPAGKSMLDRWGFVKGQLKHYGVEYDESEYSGSGTLLLKKVLQAGKCDRVPDHIEQLRKEMHAEWLDKLTPDDISSHPELIMEKYFEDRTETISVVAIPLPPSSQYRASQIHSAAEKISGLHHESSRGPETHTVFLGWDAAAVAKRAREHVDVEEKKVQAEVEEREEERAEMHQEYLDGLKKRKSKNKKSSPVGSYIIDCDEIEGNWPDQAGDLSLEIDESDEPGVFEASFNFGVLEGAMMLSTNKKLLEQYCAQLDEEDDEDEDVDEDEEDEDDDEGVPVKNNSKAGGKRCAAPSKLPRGRPPKKAKGAASQPLKFFLKLKCSETGEGQIYYDSNDGTIQFDANNLASFKGRASLPCVGSDVSFTGRKVADTPAGGSSWGDYSREAYESARVSRW